MKAGRAVELSRDSMEAFAEAVDRSRLLRWILWTRVSRPCQRRRQGRNRDIGKM